MSLTVGANLYVTDRTAPLEVEVATKVSRLIRPLSTERLIQLCIHRNPKVIYAKCLETPAMAQATATNQRAAPGVLQSSAPCL